MARVYVEVFGCSANMADSEIASGLLEEAGYTLVDSVEDAEVLLTTTCIVKKPTELRMLKNLRRLNALGKPLVVAGCMPKAERWLVEEAVPEASLMGPDDIPRVVEIVDAALKGRRLEALNGEFTDRTCLPRTRRNPVIHIAPISSGCLGDCSYCIVKRARGQLHSFPEHHIIEDARLALEEGCREIWVTAEDTAAYLWRGVRLPQLLKKLCDLNGKFFIRVGMMTPNNAVTILDELMEVFSSEKIFKFLHVPVQSGNNEVLKGMKRRYTVEDFREMTANVRKFFPDLTLSTDIICGFPGETEEQFIESMRLVEDVKPEVLNISRFWPRPGTEAADMDGQLHGRDTKRRSRMLTGLHRRLSLEGALRWVGWTGEALIDETGLGGSHIGRNHSYKPIVFNEATDLGEFIDVRVTEARSGYLIGCTDRSFE